MLRRAPHLAQVADVAAFLASDRASGMTAAHGQRHLRPGPGLGATGSAGPGRPAAPPSPPACPRPCPRTAVQRPSSPNPETRPCPTARPPRDRRGRGPGDLPARLAQA
jgi:hypothetical protein